MKATPAAESADDPIHLFLHFRRISQEGRTGSRQSQNISELRRSRRKVSLEPFTMKRKRNPAWQFPPEVEAVLRASPNLRPCKRKYGRVPYDQFLEHIRKDRCMQCWDLLQQLDILPPLGVP